MSFLQLCCISLVHFQTVTIDDGKKLIWDLCIHRYTTHKVMFQLLLLSMLPSNRRNANGLSSISSNDKMFVGIIPDNPSTNPYLDTTMGNFERPTPHTWNIVFHVSTEETDMWSFGWFYNKSVCACIMLFYIMVCVLYSSHAQIFIGYLASGNNTLVL